MSSCVLYNSQVIARVGEWEREKEQRYYNAISIKYIITTSVKQISLLEWEVNEVFI